MKRRDFLKLVAAVPLVGEAVASSKTPQRFIGDDAGAMVISRRTNMGIALEDIPKDGYGWVKIGVNGDDFAVKLWNVETS